MPKRPTHSLGFERGDKMIFVTWSGQDGFELECHNIVSSRQDTIKSYGHTVMALSASAREFLGLSAIEQSNLETALLHLTSII